MASKLHSLDFLGFDMVCSMCWPQASGGDSSSVQEQLRDVVSVTASGRSFAALRSDQTAPSAEGIEMNRGAICSKRSPFWCERGDDPTIRSFIPRDPDICSEGTSGPSKHLLYIYIIIYIRICNHLLRGYVDPKGIV